MSENKGLDIFGIKPIANAIDKSVQKSLEGIGGFLQLTCKPALGELGLLVSDKVRHWRLKNVIRMLEKAQGKLDYSEGELKLTSHPRIGLSIIENSSLIDDEVVQEMWAGLFASSCTESGTDDENLIFIDLLKQLTTSQAQILKFGVENSRKILYPNGLVVSESLKTRCEDIFELTGIKNYHRVDRELDYLRALGLISSFSGGFDPNSNELVADISPTYLSLSLYVKSQGSKLNPDEYWSTELITKEQIDNEKIEKSKEKIKSSRKENDKN